MFDPGCEDTKRRGGDELRLFASSPPRLFASNPAQIYDSLY
jgi:hypothetical protein